MGAHFLGGQRGVFGMSGMGGIGLGWMAERRGGGGGTGVGEWAGGGERSPGERH